jgi:putative intracellular protease/amidase
MKYVLANTPEGELVRNSADLSELIPRRPTPSDGPEAIPKYLDDLCNALEQMGNKYEGIIIVGGSGANVDFAYNTSLEPLLQHFCNLGKPITGICYGVTPMAQQRDFANGRPMMEGHYATGHSNRDDWTDFTGYMNEPPLGQTPQELILDAEQNSKWSSNQGTAGVNLQGALVEATGPTGGYVLPNGTVNAVLSKKDNVILITANTTPDGYPAVLLTLAAIHDRGSLNNRAIYIKDLKKPAVSAASVRCEREQLPPKLS